MRKRTKTDRQWRKTDRQTQETDSHKEIQTDSDRPENVITRSPVYEYTKVAYNT